MEKNKVLIAAPSSNRHDYVIEEWLEALSKQTYKNFDILIIDTSETTKYYNYLKRKGIRVMRRKWNPKKNTILQHLADVREIYRKIAIDEGYDYLFNLDTDIIVPMTALEDLIAFDKDQVHYVVHVFPKEVGYRPCVFKSGKILMNQKNPKRNGLEYYSWSWVNKNKGKLLKVYGGGFGVMLIKRKVFKEVPFRTHPTFNFGEDLWYYAEADAKGFESWCYVKRIPHKNASWDGIVKKETKKMGLYFAFGHVDARKVVKCKKDFNEVKVQRKRK